jgi:hypothetical protein
MYWKKSVDEAGGTESARNVNGDETEDYVVCVEQQSITDIMLQRYGT